MGRKSKVLGLLLIVVIVLVVILAFVTVKPLSIPNTSTAPTNDNAVITIQSPHNGATYNVTSLPLYFTVENNAQGFLVRYAKQSTTSYNSNMDNKSDFIERGFS